MNIRVNGRGQRFEAPLSVLALLAQTGHADMLVAIARNGDFVPKAQYGETLLQDGDSIEIVAPMQGG